MKLNKYKSVYDLTDLELEEFEEKYGDLHYPKYVDLTYYKMYYLGKYDCHLHLFQSFAQSYDVDKVLYPGSFIHVAPSFSFPDVIYADIYPGIESFFTDEEILKYIELHKFYDGETKITYLHENYESLSIDEDSIDLLISSNAGSVSVDCKKYLKRGGYLMANNGHSDADNAMNDDDYEYIGFYKYNINKDRVTFIMNGTSKKSSSFGLFQKR